MKPQHAKLLVDRHTGAIWLTDSRPGQRPKRIKDMTNEIFASLASDIVREDNVVESTKDVSFSDGTKISVTVRLHQGG